MTGSGQSTRGFSAFLMLACSWLPIFGSEPVAADPASQLELEQRVSELESLLSMRGCDNLAACSDACSSQPSVYAGYKFLFVKPQMKESFEATTVGLGTGENTLLPLDYDFHLTPNVWFGFRTARSTGARLTYWGFDHSGNSRTLVSDGMNLPGATATTVIYPAAIIAPAPGDLLQTQNSLNVQTVDAEGTIDLRLSRTQVTVGGGLRYAMTDQQMQATASRQGFTIGQLNWRREFEGFGPMMSATVAQPLVGRLSAIGNVRASLLYGKKDLTRTVIGDVTPPLVAGPPIVRLNDADEVVAAVDLGIGLQYTRKLTQQVDAFMQGSFEGQLWTEAGAPTLTFLGFQGLGFALGATY